MKYFLFSLVDGVISSGTLEFLVTVAKVMDQRFVGDDSAQLGDHTDWIHPRIQFLFVFFLTWNWMLGSLSAEWSRHLELAGDGPGRWRFRWREMTGFEAHLAPKRFRFGWRVHCQRASFIFLLRQLSPSPLPRQLSMQSHVLAEVCWSAHTLYATYKAEHRCMILRPILGWVDMLVMMGRVLGAAFWVDVPYSP